eukprot:Polyplicarium_translucidae@DN2829_c0_g1_i2.p1
MMSTVTHEATFEPTLHPTSPPDHFRMDNWEDVVLDGRAATSFGVGVVQEFRANGIVVLKFPWGAVGYFPRSHLRQDAYESVVIDMHKYFIQGQMCIAERMWEQALACFDRALKLAPFSLETRREVRLSISELEGARAHCLLRLERLNDAILSCRRSLRLNGATLQALFRLGQAHARQGSYKEASLCFQQALANPQLSAGMLRHVRAEIRINLVGGTSSERQQFCDAKSKRPLILDSVEHPCQREKMARILTPMPAIVSLDAESTATGDAAVASVGSSPPHTESPAFKAERRADAAQRSGGAGLPIAALIGCFSMGV